MNSKERLKATLAHQQGSRIVIDFGSAPVTGIHVLMLEKLRDYYGLEKRPVKVTEPYQMLGEVDEELRELLCVDVIGLLSRTTIFGFENKNWKEFRTFWGQEVLVPGDFMTTLDERGDLLIYPEGDPSVSPSAKMPASGFFFDAIIRQDPFNEENPSIEDNLEEFKPVTDKDLSYWAEQIRVHGSTGKGLVANFGGTALGDIALVPATFLKHPKGIRDIQEWYMSSLTRPDFLKEIFDRQSDVAVENLKKLYAVVGDAIDVVYMCGNDFGTQQSTFCDPDTFREIYLPYYRKMNDWIHSHTTWKTFKHSCGAVETLISSFIDAGFDILNPVQINATGMDPEYLKRKYGDQLVFWGGGVDTQKVLAFGTPGEVSDQVRRMCGIFSKNGGFVFNTVHNIQANVPVENVVAMIDTLKKINGEA
ncbi:MAG: methyltransferase [Bacteroidales bacterium]|nr:methyltransferase [Bacteroidales bacterium]